MSHTPPTTTRLMFVAALAVALGACRTTGSNTADADDVQVAGPKVGADGRPVQPEISTRAKLLFEDAVKAYDAQKKAGAFDFVSLEKKFQAALNEDGNLAEASYNLGVLAEMQGKKADAIRHYQTALQKKPTLKQAAENLAVIMQNDGDVQGAVQIYQQILENYPDDGSSRARLAQIYLQQGDHDRAMQLAREALTREPGTLNAYKVMMRSNLERNQLSMARLVALRALKLDENDPDIYFTIGQILLKEGEPEKAMLQFKRAVEVRPDYLPAHVELARMALEHEDYAGAEEHLRRILQADASNAEAHLNLGVAYKGMGQFDKAMQEYEAAEKLNPDLAAIYLNKGIILARHKDAPEAGLELYKKYVALSGGSGVGVTSDHAVFKLIDEAQAVIQAKEEAARAMAEAARMEAEMKRQAELEAQQKADAEKAKEAEAQLKGEDAPGSGKKVAKKEEAKKKDEPKKDAPAAARAVGPSGGSDDEPEDNL